MHVETETAHLVAVNVNTEAVASHIASVTARVETEIAHSSHIDNASAHSVTTTAYIEAVVDFTEATKVRT